jgi:hypothetical protein
MKDWSLIVMTTLFYVVLLPLVWASTWRDVTRDRFAPGQSGFWHLVVLCAFTAVCLGHLALVWVLR